jgi:hypothetical protein
VIKQASRTVIAIVMFYLIISTGCSLCAFAAQAADEGIIEGSTYKNEYFGLTMQIPDKWEVAKQEFTDEAQRIGKEIVAGDDNNMRVALDAAGKKLVPMLTISKYPIGTPGKANILFMSGAEKVSAFPGVKHGSDYLKHVRELLKSAKMEINIGTEINSEKIDGVDFGVMEVSFKINQNEVKQIYYAAIIKDYAYYFAYTYFLPQDLQPLKEIVRTMKFENR